MRILYVAMRYDYGDRSAGGSFEHWNFFHPLSQNSRQNLESDDAVCRRKGFPFLLYISTQILQMICCVLHNKLVWNQPYKIPL